MVSLHYVLAPEPMAHRPPLPRRFWLYSALAYLAPVIFQVAWPGRGNAGDELVWLVTLVPAFLLALHYGLRGALAGLVLGTVLFAVVQAVVALNFVPDDWHITLPIWVAYGTLAVSVGWLSEELHTFYARALRAERLAAIGEASLSIRHELGDALTVIAAQADLVLGGPDLDDGRRAAAQLIRHTTEEASALLHQLTRLDALPPIIHYSTGDAALDLRATKQPRASSPA